MLGGWSPARGPPVEGQMPAEETRTRHHQVSREGELGADRVPAPHPRDQGAEEKKGCSVGAQRVNCADRRSVPDSSAQPPVPGTAVGPDAISATPTGRFALLRAPDPPARSRIDALGQHPRVTSVSIGCTECPSASVSSVLRLAQSITARRSALGRRSLATTLGFRRQPDH